MKVLVVKIRSIALSVAAAVLVVPALAQQPSTTPMSPNSQPAQTQAAGVPVSSQPSTEQTFVGMISQEQGSYVLKDATGKSYQLDDQGKAKDYNGQSVKVTGSLDTSTHVIRVSSIAPAS